MSDLNHFNVVNRRKFLIASAGVGAVGLLGGVRGALTLPDLMRHSQNQPPLVAGSGILVIVTLYGGNDGLSTVIPYADNAYHDARPELAYAPGEVLDLDGQLGLNPALQGVSDLWAKIGLPSCGASDIRSRTAATSVRWTSGRRRRQTSP